MRVALVVHGLPPHERTGVETHVQALAAALAREEARVMVFAPRRASDLPHLAERVERRGGYDVHWLALNEPPRSVVEEALPPGVARAFGEFLERERPEVVHFHHLIKLGAGLVEECARRGIPALYTAHDYFPACPRATLLRPDLSRCDTIGDALACARCDLGAAYLRTLPALGDFHMGALPAQLGSDQAARLGAILYGDFEPGRLEAARAQRSEAEAARRAAFARFALVLAPTAFCAERLRRAGIEAARIRRQPYGVETAPLAAVAPPLRDPALPVRFGFLGGVSKHKGLHVLLEAFRGLSGRARLDVWGDSTDRPYVARCRTLAADVGAAWNGAFEASELPAVLETLDVLCVPSLWDEHAPFAIREAFAAGRPVLASRIGALAESVRDGVDGLLLPGGDGAAWSAALRSLAQDRSRAAALAQGVKPPRELRDLARELLALYRDVAGREETALSPALPAHVRPFAARYRELSRLPLAELYARVAEGLARLRQGLTGAQPGTSASAARAAAPAPAVRRAQERLRDLRREVDWLRESQASASRGGDALQQEITWLRATLAQKDEEIAWRRERDRAGAEERTHAERERAELRAAVEALASERAWLRGTLEEIEAERTWLRESLSGREAEARELREQGQRTAEQRGALEQALSTATESLTALEKHELWLREEARALAGALGAERASGSAAPIAPAELQQAVGEARERLARFRAELAWRRTEMETALSSGGGLFRALLEKTELGKRIAGWSAAPSGEARP